MSRILLRISHPEDRRLLAEWLALRYQVDCGDPEQADAAPFDLCILDGPTLSQRGPWVRAIRQAVSPLFLPFLLVTHRQGAGLATRHLWESVDELIISPIEKAELRARVEALLRARHLSLKNAVLARQLEAELQRAGRVQAELLPREAPPLPGFELAARCVPAREVGGDFYDWQELSPGVLALSVGDVMGKGMPAALLMATVRTLLRAIAPAGPPAAVVERARQVLHGDLERAGAFVTLFHAQLDAREARLRYVDAGHRHALVRRADGQVEELAQGGRPLGLTLRRPYVEGALHLRPGDALLVYSDGLLELPPAGAALAADAPDIPALMACLSGAGSAAEMVESLLALATGPPPDDLTILALRRAPAGAVP